MGWNNNGGNQNRKNDPNTKMLYGIMKELQRANALTALRMRVKDGIDPTEVDEIMDSDPGRVYRNDQQDDYSDQEG